MKKMELSILCEKICLPAEVSRRVLAFAGGFDFSRVDGYLKEFYQYDKMAQALSRLQEALGEDADHTRILACMLRASADAWTVYREKGIDDEIYFSTMKCYTRFINETFRMTGRHYFDREWWTVRQAGCHLFRIGELEYEIVPGENSFRISMHIPSDADLSAASVEESLRRAEQFFSAYYPETGQAEYFCHSWLLDPQLRRMLPEGSNIVGFQNRFTVDGEGEKDDGILQWLFHTKAADYEALPEDTTLQRGVKRHLLSGGCIRSTYGRLNRGSRRI